MLGEATWIRLKPQLARYRTEKVGVALVGNREALAVGFLGVYYRAADRVVDFDGF
jgi:hypothetical protein